MLTRKSLLEILCVDALALPPRLMKVELHHLLKRRNLKPKNYNGDSDENFATGALEASSRVLQRS